MRSVMLCRFAVSSGLRDKLFVPSCLPVVSWTRVILWSHGILRQKASFEVDPATQAL
jgi:hypothetical protein